MCSYTPLRLRSIAVRWPSPLRLTVKIGAVKWRDLDEKSANMTPFPERIPLVFSVSLVLIGWAFVWGRRFERREPRIKLGAAPFVGKWDLRISSSIIPVLLFAVAAVWLFPRMLGVLSDVWSIVVSAGIAAGFAFGLAAADGLSAVLSPVVDPNEYLANLELLPKVGDLLLLHSNYDFLVDRTVHMKGHPPGFVLILKGLAAIGLGAPWTVGALSFLGIALIVSAVAVTVRAVSNGSTMRLVLPFLALTPFCVWLGTSADAFFSGVAAWGIAFLTLAVRNGGARSRLLLGLAGGLCLTGALFLTYGAATILVLVAISVLTGMRKRFVPTFQVATAAFVPAVVITGVFYHFGFWWLDGLRLTNKFYWNGSAYFRTWTYFLLANVAVLLMAIGPAVIAGIASLRDRKLWPVVGGALVCITNAEVSQYSKGEVERIWLLFMPWLVPAVAALAQSQPQPQLDRHPQLDPQPKLQPQLRLKAKQVGEVHNLAKLEPHNTTWSDEPVHVGPEAYVASPMIVPTKWLVSQVVLAFVLQALLRSKW